MSLIIARKIENTIILLSDTKLTYSDGIERKLPKHSTVKVFQHSKSICVAFAGDCYFANVAFQQITKDKKLNEIEEILLESHRQSNGQTDYIVISLNPHEIIEIKNNLINRVSNSWIGSKRGFSKFQANYQSPLIKEPNITRIGAIELPDNASQTVTDSYSKFFESFYNVIEDDSIPEIGGFLIPVCSKKDVFVFPSYVDVYRKPLEEDEFVPNSSISFGNAEMGSYIVNFLGGNVNGIAIHLTVGGFGIIYERLESGLMKPQIIKLDEINFQDYLIETRSIKGSIMSQSSAENFNIKGSFYADKEDYLKAISYFNRALNHLASDFTNPVNPQIKYSSIYEYSLQCNKLNDGEFTQWIFNTLLNKINISYRIGDFLQVIKDCNELLKFNKLEINAIQFKVRSLQNINEKEDAFNLINGYIKLKINDMSDLFGIRGEMYFMENNFDKALEDFNTISESHPKYTGIKDFKLHILQNKQK